MPKILFISNITYKITSFANASIHAAHDLGIDFCHASNWTNVTKAQVKDEESKYSINIYNLHISRNPFSRTNLRAYKELVELIEREGIDYIHCNTPTGGLLGRLAGKKCKVKKNIYQAHGFHFYKGAPKLNWLIYYPVEKWLARYTDAIITINQEDYELAKNKFKLRNSGKVYYVPGVGIDLEQYKADEKVREEKRCELCLKEDEIAVISMGDLIKRKNYETAIRAIEKAKNKKLQYFICGRGPEENNLKMLAKELGIDDQIHFLGFRSDIKELLQAADIFLFTTKQEGLPRSLMEAMASGLPCVASRIRGNIDLLEGTHGGFLCDTMDVEAFAEKINLLVNNQEMVKMMGNNNLRTILKFSTETIVDDLCRIYETEFVGV